MRSKPARLGGISLDFAGISPRRDENFPYEGGPARQGVFLNQLCFAFQMLIK